MKKSMIILATAMLAVGSLYAVETSNVAAEQCMVQQDVDFASLEFAKVEVTNLPEGVAKVVGQLVEAGAVLKEVAVAKTAEGVEIFRLSAVKSGEESLTYLNDKGEVLKSEASAPKKEVEKKPSEK